MTRSKTTAGQGESDDMVSGDTGSTGLDEPVMKDQLTEENIMIDQERNSMNSCTPDDTESTTKQMLEALMIQNNMLMELLKLQQTKPVNEIMFAPDFHKSIPVFDGLNTRCQALDWLKTVNRVADINRWPDNFKLQSVRNNLGGPTGHWFLSRNITSWIDFENQFKRTFVGEVLVGDRCKEITRRVQRKGENVLEYFHELCSILDLGSRNKNSNIRRAFF